MIVILFQIRTERMNKQYSYDFVNLPGWHNEQGANHSNLHMPDVVLQTCMDTKEMYSLISYNICENASDCQEAFLFLTFAIP